MDPKHIAAAAADFCRSEPVLGGAGARQISRVLEVHGHVPVHHQPEANLPSLGCDHAQDIGQVSRSMQIHTEG